jgi:hypothetical protein
MITFCDGINPANVIECPMHKWQWSDAKRTHIWHGPTARSPRMVGELGQAERNAAKVDGLEAEP